MIEEEYALFLDKLSEHLGCVCNYSVQKYPAGRTLLKVLLDKDTQFTPEIKTDYWEYKLKRGLLVKLVFNSLFTKPKGDISMEAILHDAETTDEGLKEFFKRDKNSLYKDEAPTGLHAGAMIFYDSNPPTFFMQDEARDKNITGAYSIWNTKSIWKDEKGRDSIILRWGEAVVEIPS